MLVVLEVIASHRLSSVQATFNRDGRHMGQPRCHGDDGTGRDGRHVGPAYETCGLDSRHLQLDMVKLHCRKITWCME
uniref:Uncharacterized protein n=1 Tax=Hyaloperonospora arabidopsidis (strain Emoy2) TaxID=559515 RepID=M4BAN8_HYAAE